MAGLRVGQAFGVLLLPGFGVGSSSHQVPGHPSSMCDAGVNNNYYKINYKSWSKLLIIITVFCVLSNHSKNQDTRANLKTTNQITIAICSLVF